MKTIAATASAAALCLLSFNAQATTVNASQSTVTDLGWFAAGTYNITASGVISLAGAVGSGFDMKPNGAPNTPVTDPSYLYFNPNGADKDQLQGGAFGPGGTGRNLGELLGTLTATPTSPTDFFIIGSSVTETLGTAGHIYALVNDTYYSNNAGSFAVNISAAPEPAAWALMMVGVGGMGAALRTRRRKALAV